MLFQKISIIPIATTWIFVGLLDGREIAISYIKSLNKNNSNINIKPIKKVIRDFLSLITGVVMSLIYVFFYYLINN